MFISSGRQPPGDKVLMSTDMPYHFIHSLQVLKKSLWSLILYNFFFHDLIHEAPTQGQRDPRGLNFGVNRKALSLFPFVASFKEISLKSDLYNCFHDLIHVYSSGAGDKILMSKERPYHFTHLLQVSKKSLWSLILYNFVHDLIHVYSPRD